ncbi:MAG: PAS domain-containing protein [Acidobacteria bacterium]|nr:PAS domain-containing protein [Acidobacteriota bacterium]
MVHAVNDELFALVEHAKEEWLSALDTLDDPIAVYDGTGRLLRGNRALAHLNGWPLTEMKGHLCADVGLCGERADDCAVVRAVRLRETILSDREGPDGRLYAVITRPVDGTADRRDVKVVQVARDVTEAHAAAERLRALTSELASTNTRLRSALEQLRTAQPRRLEAEKLASLGDLAAGLAHELNNPLTSIIGYAELVQEEFARKDHIDASGQWRATVREDIQHIVDESRRAAKVVRNLLTFGQRRHPSEPTLISVSWLVEHAVAAYEADVLANRVTFELDIEPELPLILGTAAQLERAFGNLIANAADSARGGGDRRLTVGAKRDPSADAVVIWVMDRGAGIDASHLSRVFDPFFTTRPFGQGTGLGLSMSYGIVRTHGGQIWLESVPDAGTTCWVKLPARVPPDEGGLARLSLCLSVEDARVADFLRSVFLGWGHRVVQAHDGQDSSELLSSDLLVADAGGLAALRICAGGDADRPPLLWVATLGCSEAGCGREPAGVLHPPYDLTAIRAALNVVAAECA